MTSCKGLRMVPFISVWAQAFWKHRRVKLKSFDIRGLLIPVPVPTPRARNQHSCTRDVRTSRDFHRMVARSTGLLRPAPKYADVRERPHASAGAAMYIGHLSYRMKIL